MNRTTLLSVLLYALLVVGLATRNGGIVTLAIPLVLYLLSSFFFRPEELRFQVNRTISEDHAMQNAPVTITLSVTNKGPQTEEVLINDTVPHSLEITGGKPELFTTLQPEETIGLTYSVSGKRGSFEFDIVRVKASDHLDLFRRQVNLSAPGRLLILPEIQRLGRIAIRPFRTRFYAGQIPSKQSGAGTDFFGIRTYQMGDPLHAINWRLSARHSRSMFTNEFESERIADVGLILDARKRSDIQAEDDSLFNHTIRAAASLADAFLADSNRVGLLIYGGTLEWTFPGYGKRQRERILRALAQAQTGEHQVFKDLNYLPTRFFPAKSQLVLISPLCQDDLQPLQRLRAFGYHVLIISPDPVAFEQAHLPTNPDIKLAVRIARMERILLLHKLRRLGILVVDWQVETPLEHTVLTSMNRLPHFIRTMKAQT